jgi:hypothetical protein
LAERDLSSLLEPDSAGGELAHDEKTNATMKAPENILFMAISILLNYTTLYIYQIEPANTVI